VRKSIEWKGPIVGILEMRRHYNNYLKGLPHIKEYRARLVTVKTMEEVEGILEEVKTAFAGMVIERPPAVAFSAGQLEECAY
jgi:tRNA-dihydrouridine synthase